MPPTPDDIEDDVPVPRGKPSGPLKGERDYYYLQEISQMMFVFGHVVDPSVEVLKLVEDIVRHQLVQMIIQARNLSIMRHARHLSAEDFIFLIRYDRAKVNRLRTYLSWKDLRKNAKDDGGGGAGEVDLNAVEDVDMTKAQGSGGLSRKLKVKLPWEISTMYSDYIVPGVSSALAMEQQNLSGGNGNGNAGARPPLLPGLDPAIPAEMEAAAAKVQQPAADEELDEDEQEAMKESLMRLREADQATLRMTREEYEHYSGCRTASFTFRKGKQFRDFLSSSTYLDVRPNDDIVDVLGFLAYEVVREITLGAKEAWQQEKLVELRREAQEEQRRQQREEEQQRRQRQQQQQQQQQQQSSAEGSEASAGNGGKGKRKRTSRGGDANGEEGHDGEGASERRRGGPSGSAQAGDEGAGSPPPTTRKRKRHSEGCGSSSQGDGHDDDDDDNGADGSREADRDGGRKGRAGSHTRSRSRSPSPAAKAQLSEQEVQLSRIYPEHKTAVDPSQHIPESSALCGLFGLAPIPEAEADAGAGDSQLGKEKSSDGTTAAKVSPKEDAGDTSSKPPPLSSTEEAKSGAGAAQPQSGDQAHPQDPREAAPAEDAREEPREEPETPDLLPHHIREAFARLQRDKTRPALSAGMGVGAPNGGGLRRVRMWVI